MMLERDGYLPGVPCWIDLVQPDVDETMAFYGALFDWTFEMRTPPGAPAYAYARRDGAIVAGIGGASPGEGERSGWTNYVSVESADDAVAAVEANGGSVELPPLDIPRSGRVAVCADPSGARIGVWQPGELHGAQLVNAHGAWNFSELHTPEPDRATSFYGSVFGWVCDRLDFGAGVPTWLWRVPGYGDFLAASDPEIRERQAEAEAPGGFADAVAWMEPYHSSDANGEYPHWSVTFAVADADAAFARAESLGAKVVTLPFDTDYTRQGVVQDPQGAEMTLSEYRPPT
jgi:predicted enzyme related to lactoylglutathione lyase